MKRVTLKAAVLFFVGLQAVSAQEVLLSLDPNTDIDRTLTQFKKTLEAVEKTVDGKKTNLWKYLNTKFASKIVGSKYSDVHNIGPTAEIITTVGPGLYDEMQEFLKEDPASKRRIEKAMEKITATPIRRYVRSETLTREDLGFGGRLFLPSMLCMVSAARRLDTKQMVEEREWCPLCEFGAMRMVDLRPSQPFERHNAEKPDAHSP